MQIDHKTPLVFIDLETTGTSPRTSRVIEIGLVRVEEGRVSAEYRTLVNPGELVPEFITSLTGITSAMVASAPSFDEIALTLMEYLDGALFIAHNASFDYGFLSEEYRRIGMSFAHPHLCTAQLSRTLYHEHERHNLDSIIERFQLTPGSRHRALDDARVLWQFLTVAYGEFSEALVHDIMQDEVRARHLPAHITDSVLDALPERPGVYFFYGDADELLFVGKSRRIRTRVKSHFAKDTLAPQGQDMRSRIRRITYRETVGELGAELLETHLIAAHRPPYNILHDSMDGFVVALESVEHGYHTVTLSPANTLSQDEERTVAALFKNIDQARTLLSHLAVSNRLCPYLLGVGDAHPCSEYARGVCAGACIGKEKPRHYNKRFREAFAHHRITPWPYQGPVVVEERDHNAVGELFILDRWRLLAALHRDGAEWEEFIPARFTFDYDVYKIFSRELLKRKPKVSVRPLTNVEAARIRGDEHVII